MHPKLAIVIPGFKSRFLGMTLDSIANQTCKDFTVYFGDDASPENLFSVVSRYQKSLPVIYRRFEHNLGSTNLVAHWNRCIDMVAGEEYIWLFSDDDLMDSRCVEKFYEQINNGYASNALFHFNVDVIDEQGLPSHFLNPFPASLSSEEFFAKRLRSEIHSYVVEYIFKKSVYVEKGRFESFDLGWWADDAAWIKLGVENGITTIAGPKVKWRYSTVNISSQNKDRDIIIRKLNATLDYLKWAGSFFSGKSTTALSGRDKVKGAVIPLLANSSLTTFGKYKLTLASVRKLNDEKGLRLYAALFLTYLLLKNTIVRIPVKNSASR